MGDAGGNPRNRLDTEARVIHYHGTPITPGRLIYYLAGRNFCVSFYEPRQVRQAHEIGQSVMLDNGAFTAWRQGTATDWKAYYRWVEPWLDYWTTWAVVPDVIDGDSDANDALLAEWPHGARGAPVWHMHEPIARLLRLAEAWPRLCLGSSGEYAVVGSARWHDRMTDAMNRLCGDGPPPVWLHMLRGMSLSGLHYPFASVDSTDIARNHNAPQNSPRKMVERWDCAQTPARWIVRPVHGSLLEAAE